MGTRGILRFCAIYAHFRQLSALFQLSRVSALNTQCFTCTKVSHPLGDLALSRVFYGVNLVASILIRIRKSHYVI